jgi:hypothetical protein
MKTKFLILSMLCMVIGVSSLFAQGFQPPAPGKAVVYFTRTTGYAFAISFEYFHQDKYIGVFKGSNYMRYELDPGQQLVWASSENKEFVAGDFKEGGSYIILVDVNMGLGKARVELNPINASDERYKKAKELIISKAPVVTPPEKIEELNKKLAEFIPEQLRKYEQEWKDTKVVKHMSADMAISEEAMK